MTVKAAVKVPVTNSTVSLIDICLFRPQLNENKFQLFFLNFSFQKLWFSAAYHSLAHRNTGNFPNVFYHITEETAVFLLSCKGGNICKTEGTAF